MLQRVPHSLSECLRGHIMPLQCPLSAPWVPSALSHSAVLSVFELFECNWNILKLHGTPFVTYVSCVSCVSCVSLPVVLPALTSSMSSIGISSSHASLCLTWSIIAALYCALAPKTVNLTRLLTSKIQHLRIPKIEWGNASWNERWSPLDRPMAPDGFFRLLFSTLGVRY